MSAPRELDWRTLPLAGTTLIEASAGTGKTWNIALLHLRLLIERGLTVRQILVTTFTDAAADELKSRIRLRLLDAERLAVALANGRPIADAERELADFIGARVDVEGSAPLLARLRLALADVDLAPISTIHSFCRRVLTEFPFDTGVAFTLGEVVDEPALVRECVEDFWRFSFLGDSVDPWFAGLLLPQGLEAFAGRVGALIAAPQATLLTASTAPLREWWARFVASDHGALAAALRQIDAFKLGEKSGLRQGLGSLLEGAAAADPGRVLWKKLAEWLVDDKIAWAWKKSQTTPFAERPEFQALMAARELFDGAELRVIQEAACSCAAFTAGELRQRLSSRGQSSFSQWIAEVHERLSGERGAALAQRLADAWPAALIDEFQDTDSRQWAIFQRLYGNDRERTLILIGDPKQSIYAFRGGDIHTYLAARDALSADRVHSIRRNFRSHPELLAALNGIYALADAVAFGASGIDYVAVSAGRPERFATELVDRPLRLRVLANASTNAGERDAQALAACANDIAQLLNDPAARVGSERVAPGHIAVLVDTNYQLRELRALLVERRVPVVGAGRAHVLATALAEDLQLLLHALLHPGDEQAVRGALATRLLGVDAAGLAALAGDAGAWEHTLGRFGEWRLDWERRGILAVIEAIVVEQAPRLLAAADGERALTDLRHLGEVLQHAAAECYGPEELYEWFVQTRLEGAGQHEAAREMQLRIESETRRVQLLTVHASKGLEFPIVFLPLAWRYRKERADAGMDMARFHDDQHRLCLDLGTPQFDAHKEIERREALQERLRQLYVALTRAEHAVRLYAFDDLRPGVDLADPQRSGLDVLLAAALAGAVGANDVNPWQALQAAVPALALDDTTVAHCEFTAPATGNGRRQARSPLPASREVYGLYSFSALTRATPTAGDGERGAEDEAGAEPPAPSLESAPHPALLALEKVKGPRFGDAIHQLLEAGPGELPFAQQPGRIAHALADQAVRLLPEQAGEQLAAIAAMLDRTLTAELAPGLSLGTLTSSARPEFEFAFALDGARWGRLPALLAAHGLGDWWPRSEDGRELNGLMKGYVDLVFAHGGRYHVLDYKTNFLGTRSDDYRGEGLDIAMREHHYGLQALIYSVALHRYLGRRIDDYDPRRHLGDCWYLFVRAIGLDGDAGLWRRRFTPELIAALDLLFEGAEVDA
jgi:exodeoxyribonuclease V beta subunit